MLQKHSIPILLTPQRQLLQIEWNVPICINTDNEPKHEMECCTKPLHTTCLTTWLKTPSATCPLCRQTTDALVALAILQRKPQPRPRHDDFWSTRNQSEWAGGFPGS